MNLGSYIEEPHLIVNFYKINIVIYYFMKDHILLSVSEFKEVKEKFKKMI